MVRQQCSSPLSGSAVAAGSAMTPTALWASTSSAKVGARTAVAERVGQAPSRVCQRLSHVFRRGRGIPHGSAAAVPPQNLMCAQRESAAYREGYQSARRGLRARDQSLPQDTGNCTELRCCVARADQPACELYNPVETIRRLPKKKKGGY